uniref:Aspartate-semialdehyde dehydrogenase n=1 Tax=uncultured bacterium contig00016 TaxID=1181507 RepID=A0A806JZZ3_9BACT|nr:aspartate-semialdehyde dehydrogenase [uncultured bacterium contig00016]
MKNVAIAGATGAVGQEFLSLLDERNFPLKSLKLLASARSAGKKIKFRGEDITVQELRHDSFSGVELVLSSAGGSISKEYMPSAVKAGAVVVDNTSFFRMKPDVPLVVPEINPQDIKKHKGIIANPNCSTIIMLLPLFPLYKAFGVERVHACTYQAASGAGATAMEELRLECIAIAEGKPFTRTVIPHQYAFNLFPHNSPYNDGSPEKASSFAPTGYCEEEWKMVAETHKIFGDSNLRVNATCVRVPVLRAHSEALNIRFSKKTSVAEIYDVLRKAPGVEILEDPSKNRWPMPIDASGKDPVFAGRVRIDQSQENTFDIWVAGDQIRKGAALNAMQIAELL